MTKNANLYKHTAKLNQQYFDSNYVENSETIKKNPIYDRNDCETIKEKDLMNDKTRQFIDENVPHKDFRKGDKTYTINLPDSFKGNNSKPNFESALISSRGSVASFGSW